MGRAMDNQGNWRSRPWRVAAWSAAAGLMALPLTVQLVSGGFGWSLFDFVFAAAILFVSCFIFDLAARRSPNFAYLAGSGLALAAGFGLVVVNGAVGLVGSEDEAHNLLFLIPILAAIAGALVARGRADGMARAMLSAGIAHVAVSAVLLIRTGGGIDGGPGVELVGLSIFAAMWLGSAAFYHRAGR